MQEPRNPAARTSAFSSQNQTSSQAHMDYDGFSASHNMTFGALFADIRRARLYILTGLACGLLCAAGFMALAIPHYKASIILSPAAPMTGAESSSMLANDNLFALRFLVQRLGSGQGSDFQRFENIYTGPSVAAILLKDRKIESGLKADQSFSFLTPEQSWNAEKLSEYLGKRLRLEPMGVTSARRLTYHHADPEFARYLVSAVHHIADGLIRHTIREDSKARVDYLNKASSETTNPEHRRALTTLLMEQERLLMLVSIDQPYAASVIEPASSGVKPQWPDKKLTFAGFALIFAFLGYLVYGARRP